MKDMMLNEVSANQEIPEHSESLDKDIQKRLNDVISRFNLLKNKRDYIAKSMDSSIPLAIITIQAAMKAFYVELQCEIPIWVNGFTPKIDWLIYASRKDLENVIMEVLEFIKGKTSEQFEKWNEEVLQKSVEEQANLVFGRLKENIDGISDYELFLGDFDLSRFMNTLATDLGIGMKAGLMETFDDRSPLKLFSAIYIIMNEFLVGRSAVITRIKIAVSDYIVRSIQENADQQIKDVSKKVRCTFDDIKDSVLKGVDTEIKTVEVQVKLLEEILRSGRHYQL